MRGVIQFLAIGALAEPFDLGDRRFRAQRGIQRDDHPALCVAIGSGAADEPRKEAGSLAEKNQPLVVLAGDVAAAEKQRLGRCVKRERPTPILRLRL